MRPQTVARKYVSMVDQVVEETRTLVPAFTSITRVDTQEVVSFTREKARPVSNVFQEWNDLQVSHLIGLSRRGDCE